METGDANRITTDGTWNYSYDFEGNLTKRVHISSGQTWTYGYDHRNQMIWAEDRVSDGGDLTKRIDFAYDVYGNLVRTTLQQGSATEIEKHAYEITDKGLGFTKSVHNEWAQLDSSGSLTIRYMTGNYEADRFARLDVGSGNWYWMLQDRLNSIREVLNATGAILVNVWYDLAGNVAAYSGDSTNIGKFRHHGTLYVVYVDMSYMKYRYVLLSIDVWTTEDPIGTAGGDANFRRAMGNNGLNSTDRNGLWEIKRDGQATAKAVSEKGDTIKALADRIGFDVQAGEHWDWLTMPAIVNYYDRGMVKSGQTQHAPFYCPSRLPLVPGQVFEIPNEMIFLWARNGGRLGRAWVDANGDVDYLKARGFKVFEFKTDVATELFDLGCREGKLIRELLKDKQFAEVVDRLLRPELSIAKGLDDESILLGNRVERWKPIVDGFMRRGRFVWSAITVSVVRIRRVLGDRFPSTRGSHGWVLGIAPLP